MENTNYDKALFEKLIERETKRKLAVKKYHNLIKIIKLRKKPTLKDIHQQEDLEEDQKKSLKMTLIVLKS